MKHRASGLMAGKRTLSPPFSSPHDLAHGLPARQQPVLFVANQGTRGLHWQQWPTSTGFNRLLSGK